MTNKGNKAIEIILNNTYPIKVKETKKVLHTLLNELKK